MTSGAAEEREASPAGDRREPGRGAGASSEQEDLAKARPPRAQRRALEEAKPENDRIAVRPARERRRARPRCGAEKNQDRGFGHGASATRKTGRIGITARAFSPPGRRLLIDDCAPRS